MIVLPEQQQVVIGTADGMIRLWQFPDHRIVRHFSGLDSMVNILCSNGNVVIASSRRSPQLIHVWTIASEEHKTIHVPSLILQDPIRNPWQGDMDWKMQHLYVFERARIVRVDLVQGKEMDSFDLDLPYGCTATCTNISNFSRQLLLVSEPATETKQLPRLYTWSLDTPHHLSPGPTLPVRSDGSIVAPSTFPSNTLYVSKDWILSYETDYFCEEPQCGWDHVLQDRANLLVVRNAQTLDIQHVIDQEYEIHCIAATNRCILVLSDKGCHCLCP